MPACRQCGKDNPEGTVFCGYCATPLARPAGATVSPPPKANGDPVSSPSARGTSPQPKPFKPEIRTPTFHSSPPPSSGSGKGKGGFELIPWSELSATQRAGRSVAVAIVLFLIFFSIRGMLRDVRGARATGGNEPAAEGSSAPITQGDRRDGIESLCKVFQIYGLPKNEHDATEAARNAGELFKLAGNQSPERSVYILTTIVGEFRFGKLGPSDCAEAGVPIATTEQNTQDSTPDIPR